MGRLTLATTAALLMSLSAFAASFDCRRAATPVEKLICSDSEVSDLDEKLAEAFQRSLKTAIDTEKERRHQREWLKTVRDACHDAACLKKAYAARLAALNKAETQPKNGPAKADQYKLAMSKDDKVCRHMLNLFNEDLKKHGIEQYSSVEFAAIRWRSLEYSYDRGPNVSAPRLIRKAAETTTVDLDNDGTNETLLREPSSKYDIQIYEYLVLTQPSLLGTNVVTASVFERGTEHLGGLGGPNAYELRALPPKKEHGVNAFESVIPDRVEPFVFNGATYISIRQLPRFDLATMAEVSGWRYHVVARYKPGMLKDRHAGNPAELLDDVCYLERVVR